MSVLSERLFAIRTFRRLKQHEVAAQMGITQQSYSWFEYRSKNIQVDSLARFCKVMNISLPFLLAFDVPISQENIDSFDRLLKSMT